MSGDPAIMFVGDRMLAGRTAMIPDPAIRVARRKGNTSRRSNSPELAIDAPVLLRSYAKRTKRADDDTAGWSM